MRNTEIFCSQYSIRNTQYKLSLFILLPIICFMKNTHLFKGYKLKTLIIVALILGFLIIATPPVYAGDKDSTAYLLYRGTSRVITAPFSGASTMLQQTVTRPFPYGMVTGTLNGTMKIVEGVLSGAIDLARGAAPYAKYLVFLL